jgi:uncharacterized protein
LRLTWSRLAGVNQPIFRSATQGQSLYYTPGCLAGINRELAEDLEQVLAGQVVRAGLEAELLTISQSLQSAAKAAMESWKALQTSPYKPLCLTLYPHNDCNLACSYCYAEARPSQCTGRLSLDSIRAAAVLVAENCQQECKPLVVVFHGGGEPSLYIAWLQQALEIVERTAAQFQLPIFRYIATNGVMPENDAAWLAEHFDSIGLSCDEPGDIQNAQRPRYDGRPSSAWVEQTARMVHQSGKPLRVRVTITPASLHRQSEIADYLCEKIRPEEISVEPVYCGGRAAPGSAFEPSQAAEFVQAFMLARQHAKAFGIPWKTSGSRLREVHGPYCHILRSVLLLVPGDEVSACFKSCQASQVRQQGLSLGFFDNTGGKIHLNEQQAAHLRQDLVDSQNECASCFNQFHCTRLCPDFCLLTHKHSAGSFRCQLQKLLSIAYLEELAGQMVSGGQSWCVPITPEEALDGRF